MSGNKATWTGGRVRSHRELDAADQPFWDDAGFYRVLELDEGRLKVKHLTTLREHFTVFRDADGELRCDHLVRFLGMTMLRLHYRMRPRA